MFIKVLIFFVKCQQAIKIIAGYYYCPATKLCLLVIIQMQIDYFKLWWCKVTSCSLIDLLPNIIQLTTWLIRGSPCFLRRLLWVLYTAHMERTVLSIWKQIKHTEIKRRWRETNLYKNTSQSAWTSGIWPNCYQNWTRSPSCGQGWVRTLALSKSHPWQAWDEAFYTCKSIFAYIITHFLPRSIHY